MDLRVEPVLARQRALLDLPRSGARFKRYLDEMRGGRKDDIALPLPLFNPMARDHVAVFLDRALELDFEGVAAQAAADASTSLPDAGGALTVWLVVGDDRGGGWTNRFTAEFSACFETRAMLTRGMIVVPLWSSESPARDDVRRETVEACARAGWSLEHGRAETLAEILRQARAAARLSGRRCPLDGAAIAQIHTILAPRAASRRKDILIPALYGDDAAASLGMPALGLPDRAGLALAASDHPLVW